MRKILGLLGVMVGSVAAAVACGGGSENSSGCDCKVLPEIFNRPLCEATVQHYAKAYPAGRILQVLQGYGANAVVASICAKNPTCDDPIDTACGYNPAMSALLNRMKPALQNP